MALNLWEPFNRSLVAPWRRAAFWTDPFEQALDRLFDDSMNIQLRDHAAQLKVDEQGNLTYKVDVSGFRPEELNVEVQGNEIVVRGEHREQNQGEAVHRQFIRRVVIPEGIKKESIKSELDNGRLCICAQRGQQKGDGPKPKLIEIDGEIWPPVFEAENVRSARGMELEAGDTLVCTYPKCGTTWVQHICSQLIFPGQYGVQGQKELCFTSPMIERMGAAFCADQLAHPRLLKTHFSWGNCPNKSGAAKFIFVARNPKDCLVSFFHHHRSFRCYQWAQGDFDVFFELFMGDRLDFGDYFDHLLGWLPHLEEPNVLFLKYEQMVADLEGAIRRIGAFLGGMAAQMVESQAKLGEIVAASRFDAMQSKQEQFFPPNALQNNFIRKGGSRDWKNWMSRRQSDRLDALFQAKMKGTAAEGWWRKEMQWEDEGEKENESADERSAGKKNINIFIHFLYRKEKKNLIFSNKAK